jgi:hypothetical protein
VHIHSRLDIIRNYRDMHGFSDLVGDTVILRLLTGGSIRYTVL